MLMSRITTFLDFFFKRLNLRFDNVTKFTMLFCATHCGIFQYMEEILTRQKVFKFKAIYISDRKGIRKKNIDSTNLIADFGLEYDAHAL